MKWVVSIPDPGGWRGGPSDALLLFRYHPVEVGCRARFEGGLRLISLRDPPRPRPLAFRVGAGAA